MKILYVTNKPIYPIVDGGCFAMDSFLRSLLSFATVKNISLSTHKHTFDLNLYPKEITTQISPEAFFINTKFRFLPFFKSLLLQKSYNAIRFYNKGFLEKMVHEINDSNYDYLIFESSYLLVYIDELKKIFNGKMILRAPNVEYKIWEDYSHFSTSLIKKGAYSFLANMLKKYEILAVSKVDKVLAITENDKFQFTEDKIKVPIDVIPFGINCNQTEIPSIEPNKIFFLGAYNWKPNLDAANYLIQEIFPELVIKFPNLELHLAGSYTPESFYLHKSKNIIVHGKVASSIDFMKNNGILIAPIFSGSGVRIKILEALSLAIPVIASTIAMQGIPTKSVLIADNKKEFVNQICKLLNQNELINDIQQKAIDTIQHEFTIEQISLILKKSLNAQ